MLVLLAFAISVIFVFSINSFRSESPSNYSHARATAPGSAKEMGSSIPKSNPNILSSKKENRPEKVTIKESIVDPLRRPSSSLITIGGELHFGIANKLGLKPDQAKAIQQELSRFWEKMASVIAERASYDEAASNEQGKKDVYRIPSLTDSGTQLRLELTKAIAEEAGEANARLLVEGINPYSFGGLGRFDVVLEFTPDPVMAKFGSGPDATRVLCKYTDPESGQKVLEVECSLDRFTEMFGAWSVPRRPPW